MDQQTKELIENNKLTKDDLLDNDLDETEFGKVIDKFKKVKKKKTKKQ